VKTASIPLRLAATVLGVALAGCSSPGTAPPSGGPIGTPRVVTVTGRPLYSKSETEFVFSDGATTWDVSMDLSTRCVNLRGSLLGGYQFVTRIMLVTSLPLTVTGIATGTSILARTVLLPTDKDKIT
jgi:hypothetical protein